VTAALVVALAVIATAALAVRDGGSRPDGSATGGRSSVDRPWDRPARVADAPNYEALPRDVVCRGAFDDQLGDRGKVFVNVEHESGVRGIVYRGVELRDEREGLHGTFKLHKNIGGDKTLELVREGLFDGISLEAIALQSIREGGVVKRLQAKLKAVPRVAILRSPMRGCSRFEVSGTGVRCGASFERRTGSRRARRSLPMWRRGWPWSTSFPIRWSRSSSLLVIGGCTDLRS
jgi:HK97 family phage prohead protease